MTDLVKLTSYKEDNIFAYADRISLEVLEGNHDAISKVVQAKAIIKVAERVIKTVKDNAIDEAGNYAKGENTYNGATFSLKNTGETLDYDQDEIVKDLNKQLKERKAELKAAYEMHKKNGKVIMDSEGEIVPVIKIKTEASTTISVTFKEK